MMCRSWASWGGYLVARLERRVSCSFGWVLESDLELAGRDSLEDSGLKQIGELLGRVLGFGQI